MNDDIRIDRKDADALRFMLIRGIKEDREASASDIATAQALLRRLESAIGLRQ